MTNIDTNAPLTTDDLQAMVLTSAATLAERWMAGCPELQPHIQYGATIEMGVTLAPLLELRLELIDSNGTRMLIAQKKLTPSMPN
ncbi:MAG: hypothetical protein V4794_19480 [Pseudomonadota bacterium]